MEEMFDIYIEYKREITGTFNRMMYAANVPKDEVEKYAGNAEAVPIGNYIPQYQVVSCPAGMCPKRAAEYDSIKKLCGPGFTE